MMLEFDLTWNTIEIHVAFVPDWHNTTQAHLEITSKEPLPITNTGYKSHLLPQSAVDDWDSVEDYVLTWLEEASHSKEWKQIWDARQQLSFGF